LIALIALIGTRSGPDALRGLRRSFAYLKKFIPMETKMKKTATAFAMAAFLLTVGCSNLNQTEKGALTGGAIGAGVGAAAGAVTGGSVGTGAVVGGVVGAAAGAYLGCRDAGKCKR